MDELNRRELLMQGLPVAVIAALHPALPVEQPEECGESRCETAWHDNYLGEGNYVLAVGFAGHSGHNLAGTVQGILWEASRGQWTFRVGVEFHNFPALNLATAKKLAEYQMVEAIKRCLVTLEKFVFSSR